MEEKSGSSYDGGDEKTNDQKVDQEIVLPGFRFHPTDEELVGFYLKRKIQQRPFSIELIKQLDIYKFDPWDLPKFASSTAGEKEWYFYCPRDRKYRNSARPNRVTGAGFWKATGTDRPIYSSSSSSTEAGTSNSRSKCIIGLKKSLVFYKGRAARGIKTDWMMHEFRLPSRNDMLHHTNRSADDTTTHHPPTAADSWAICRIFKKTSTSTHRAIPHSWVSPSSPLLNRTTGAAGGGGGAHDHFNNSAHDEINNASPPSNTTSASMQNNMMINNEMTSLPLSQYLPTNLLDFPAPYYKPIYPLVNNKQVSSYEVYQPISSMPTSYSLPPLEVVPEPTKCNMPFFNLSSSSSVLGDFGKLSGGTVLDVAGQNRRCDSDGGRDDNHHYNFSVSLPSSEAQKHAEEEDLQMSFLSNLQQEQIEMNNINMDDQYWGALQSIDQSPTGPLSMPEVAMKLPSLWECLSNYPPPSHDLATLASLFCSELAS